VVKVGGEIAILSTKEAYSGWGRHLYNPFILNKLRQK